MASRKGMIAPQNSGVVPQAIPAGKAATDQLTRAEIKTDLAVKFPTRMLPPLPSGYSDEVGAHRNLDNALRNEAVQTRTLSPYTTADAQDAYWDLVTQYVDGHGVVPGIGQVYADPSYWAYQQRKMSVVVENQFKQFIFGQIDLSTPAKRAFWEKKFPQYLREFEEGLERELDNKKKMAMIGIRGVKSEADMWYLFQKSKGVDRPFRQSTTPQPPFAREATQNAQTQANFKNTDRVVDPIIGFDGNGFGRRVVVGNAPPRDPVPNPQ